MTTIKDLRQRAKNTLNNQLTQIKAKANQLKSAVGSQADAIKKDLSKMASAYTDNALFAPLLPLMPTMLILLKKKGVKVDEKSLGGVARAFYREFVDATASFENLEMSNFEFEVMRHLDEKGTSNTTGGDADHADLNNQLLSVASGMGAKDPSNQAGKTAGSLVASGLGLAGVPIPPQVGSAVGGVIQGIVRGIINFFKAKKGNKDIADALKQGNADMDKIETPTDGGAISIGGDKTIFYIFGAIVVIGIAIYALRKK